MTTYSDVLSAIRTGELDDHLDDIRNLAQNRRSIIANYNAQKLNPGDSVTFNDTIRPKYLAGLEATVTKVNKKSVVVACPDDPAYGRYQNSGGVRCPNSLIHGLT